MVHKAFSTHVTLINSFSRMHWQVTKQRDLLGKDFFAVIAFKFGFAFVDSNMYIESFLVPVPIK